jgi:choice-of-anchor B domain-containing protein
MKNTIVIILLTLSCPLSAQLNLELLAHVPNDSNITLAGCWHYVDSSANEYALVGTKAGLSIFDVSVPTQPLRRFQIPGVISNWREVKTWGGFAYIGSEGGGSGITIVDLRQLPDTIYWKVWYGDDSLTNKIQKSHTVGAEDGYLYVFGSTAPNNGAIICSLDDPWNPTFVGQYQGNYLHDGFIRGDTLWGSEIYQGQFSVIDISDKSQPVLLATQPTPGAFNHNTGLSKNSHYLFTADEKTFTPLGAFDVTDLDNITLTDIYYPSQKPASMVHNVRVFGDDFLICPSYGGQLTIVDASDPYNLIETAWAVVGTSLVWDADPYLPSGIIFAGAKNEGFFIFKPTYVRAARLQGTVTDAATGASLNHAKIFLINTPNADTTGMNGKYATGAASGGSYSIRAEKEGYDTLIINNVLLTNNTVQTVDIALQPSAVGTGDLQKTDNKVNVYPTLVKGSFWVAFAEEQPMTRIELIDVNGKVVYQSTVSGKQNQIFTGQLLPGMYWVKTAGVVAGQITVID